MNGQSIRLSLSHYSYNLFDQCPRKWVLNYACDHLPETMKWDVKKQKKLMAWHMLAGQVIDYSVSAALLQYKREGKWPSDLRRVADICMKDWWQFSHSWVADVKNGRKWPKREPFQPIDRHYYQEPVTEEEKSKTRGRVYKSLENFLTSELPDFLGEFHTKHWQGPRASGEQLPRCLLGEVPVWAVYDFSIRTPDLTYIFDWKSGEYGSSSCRAMEQLKWYALYAVSEWKIPVERIRLCPVWLWPTVVWKQIEVGQGDLDELRARIEGRYRLLAGKLGPDRSGDVVTTDWAISPDAKCCRGCQFRGSCEGYRRVNDTPSQ